MKYTITINQKGLAGDPDITLQEASVISWIHDFCSSTNHKITLNRKEGWTLVRTQHLVDDMPLLRIRTRAGATKLLGRLEELGYIEIKRKPQKLYIRQTEKITNLYFEVLTGVNRGVNSSKQTVNSGKRNCLLGETYHNTNHNTNHNTISSTSEASDDPQEKEEVIKSSQLPKERGKTYILRVLSVYRDLFEELYGFKPVISIPRYSKQVKELAFLKSELEIASLLIVFFDWYGVTGNDSFEREKLVKAQHPLGWFFASINSYEAHLRNVIGLKIEDENELRAFVAKRMLSIKK